MNYQVNRLRILSAAFGIGSYYATPGGDNTDIQFKDIQTKLANPDGKKNLFGFPIQYPIRFEHDDYGSIDLEDAPLITVTQSRNIVKTALQGRDGTVKEFISNGDYKVSIVGLITDAEKTFPTDAVESLERVLKLKAAHKVVSDFLNLFQISNLVVEDYELKPVEGFVNMCAYRIEAVSDDAIELQA